MTNIKVRDLKTGKLLDEVKLNYYRFVENEDFKRLEKFLPCLIEDDKENLFIVEKVGREDARTVRAPAKYYSLVEKAEKGAGTLTSYDIHEKIKKAMRKHSFMDYRAGEKGMRKYTQDVVNEFEKVMPKVFTRRQITTALWSERFDTGLDREEYLLEIAEKKLLGKRRSSVVIAKRLLRLAEIVLES